MIFVSVKLQSFLCSLSIVKFKFQAIKFVFKRDRQASKNSILLRNLGIESMPIPIPTLSIGSILNTNTNTILLNTNTIFVRY